MWEILLMIILCIDNLCKLVLKSNQGDMEQVYSFRKEQYEVSVCGILK